MSSSEPKVHLEAEDFKAGLNALDAELGKSEMVAAFAPIKVIAAGGCLAVLLLRSRVATGDLDYLLEPEWASDNDIKNPLQDAILKTAKDLFFNDEWANEDMALFVTKDARKSLFEKAEEQGICLFKGDNIQVLAAPIEWALERKVRRIYAADRGRKAEFDMSDCLAMLKYMRDRDNKLVDREYIRSLNVNTFDVTPSEETMDLIENSYRERYKEEIFQDNSGPA